MMSLHSRARAAGARAPCRWRWDGCPAACCCLTAQWGHQAAGEPPPLAPPPLVPMDIPAAYDLGALLDASACMAQRRLACTLEDVRI